MNHVLVTVLSGLVFATLIAPHALAETKTSTQTMPVNDMEKVDLERAYLDKFGS